MHRGGCQESHEVFQHQHLQGDGNFNCDLLDFGSKQFPINTTFKRFSAVTGVRRTGSGDFCSERFSSTLQFQFIPILMWELSHFAVTSLALGIEQSVWVLN
jgi:hypothetical protein